MKKNIFAFLSVLVLASMVLSACAPAAPATPAETQPPAATEPPTTDEFTCDDPIGCVTIAPGEPVHIAYALVIAGPDETLGVDSRNGIEVAIANTGSEILGHPVQFDGTDDGCSAEGGQAAGTRLAADPTIVAVIATSCSSAARVAVPLLSQAGFTIVSPSNTAPDLTEAGNENQHPGYFRTAHSDSIQGAAAAQFAIEELGVTTAATIHDGSIYAEKLQEVFAENFQQMGGTITATEAVDPNQTDMGAVLTSIATGSPELIYFPIFIAAGSLIIRQAQQTSGLEETHLMGADGLFSPDVTEGAGDAVEGFMVSSPDLAAFGAQYESEFVPRYQEMFGTEPISIFHAHAHDAYLLIKHGIEQVAVQEEDGTLHIPRQGLRDAMYAIENFQGLTGNLTCSDTGDCADPQIAVYEFHAGEFPPEKIWP